MQRESHDHLKFSAAGRAFLYLPFEHSEDRECQVWPTLAVTFLCQFSTLAVHSWNCILSLTCFEDIYQYLNGIISPLMACLGTLRWHYPQALDCKSYSSVLATFLYIYIYIPFEMMNIWIYYIWTAECLCVVILALSKLRSLDVGYISPIPSFGLVVELSARKVL